MRRFNGSPCTDIIPRIQFLLPVPFIALVWIAVRNLMAIVPAAELNAIWSIWTRSFVPSGIP